MLSYRILSYPIFQIVEMGRANLLTRPVSALYTVAQAMHDAVARKCPDAFGDMYVQVIPIVMRTVRDLLVNIRFYVFPSGLFH